MRSIDQLVVRKKRQARPTLVGGAVRDVVRDVVSSSCLHGQQFYPVFLPYFTRHKRSCQGLCHNRCTQLRASKKLNKYISKITSRTSQI